MHAIRRMFERQLDVNEVREVIDNGELVEDYIDDEPYPSQLLLGWSGKRPIHVVVADNTVVNQLIVVTVYEPDLAEWEPGFKRRKLL